MDEGTKYELSALYQESLDPQQLAPLTTGLPQAIAVVSNPTSFPRDTLALTLTALRQCVCKWDLLLALDVQLDLNSLFAISTKLLCATCDRFVMVATRDLLITIQQCLHSQDVMVDNLIDLLTQTFSHFIHEQREAGIVTLIEIMTQTFSFIRQNFNSPASHQVLKQYLSLYYSWGKVLDEGTPTHLICAARLQCLSKVIKLSRLDSCVHLLTPCRLLLTNHSLKQHLCNCPPMLWRFYLKCFCLMLQTDIRQGDKSELSQQFGQKRAELSQWILTNISQSLVEDAPVPVDEHGKINVDYLRAAVHVVLLANVIVAKYSLTPDADGEKTLLLNLGKVSETVSRRLGMTQENCAISTWFFDVCFGQDDVMAECLLSLLEFYSILSRNKTLTADLSWLDPWELFSSLVEHLHYGYHVMLDWVISPETVFLQYLLCILHHILLHWQTIATNYMLEYDMDACTVPRAPTDCQMVALTSGFESLMAYSDDESLNSCDVDSSCNSDSDDSLLNSGPSLKAILHVLSRLSYFLRREQDLTPFRTDPLIKLLDQVLTLGSQCGICQ